MNFPAQYQRLTFRIEISQGFWQSNPLTPSSSAHRLIADAIIGGTPYCVARLGIVESHILRWGRGIRSPWAFNLKMPPWFFETYQGATNAGIRPRNRKSYRGFANLAAESLSQVDVMGVWSQIYEETIFQHLGLKPVFTNVEGLSAGLTDEINWMQALVGKKILVVSPFKATILAQLPKLGRIWPGSHHPLEPEQFTIEQFPYLIDDSSGETWESTWEKFRQIVSAGDYDVALFGCGGLGLPLAATAKQAGKVGIHIGGLLQLMFGIYGRRHLEQEWHARYINEAWIRPSGSERPESATRVEGGCYW